MTKNRSKGLKHKSVTIAKSYVRGSRVDANTIKQEKKEIQRNRRTRVSPG